MKIIVLGAGVQGTVFGVRLARAGHEVTLVSRRNRVTELRQFGSTIQDAQTGKTYTASPAVLDCLSPELTADLCLVTVRREQIDTVLPDLAQATAIPRIVFMVNHANGSDNLFASLGRSRVVLAFPGIAGSRDGRVVRYVEVSQQHTVVEDDADDIISLFRDAGFRVDRVRDVDAWLRRHAVFITAIAGALYEKDCDARRLAADSEALGRFIWAVREGWAALDRKRIADAPLALRIIFRWVPLQWAVEYWRRLLRSSRGDLYFARHARHAPAEMAAIAADVRSLAADSATPNLMTLLEAIESRLHDVQPTRT
jgi:ketopantoate reductase